MNEAQLELPIPTSEPPRVRVRLDVPSRTVDDGIERTDWNDTDDPPCAGWWEVREGVFDPSPNAWKEASMRWWWTGSRWLMAGPRPGVKSDSGLSGQEFREKLKASWRGLTKPSALVYPTPPYDTKELVTRAQTQGRAIRTKYVSVTPRPRERVRLD